jgi:hypothetical protein
MCWTSSRCRKMDKADRYGKEMMRGRKQNPDNTVLYRMYWVKAHGELLKTFEQDCKTSWLMFWKHGTGCCMGKGVYQHGSGKQKPCLVSTSSWNGLI